MRQRLRGFDPTFRLAPTLEHAQNPNFDVKSSALPQPGLVVLSQPAKGILRVHRRDFTAGALGMTPIESAATACL